MRRVRQQALERGRDPLRLLCVIDESALAREVGDAETMVEQLDHLMAQARKPNVQVRVAPFGRSVYGAVVGDFSLLTLPGAAGPETVCTEDLLSIRYLEAPHEVEGYDALFDHLYHRSLSPTDSLACMAKHRRNHES